jgi:hypothetical protein
MTPWETWCAGVMAGIGEPLTQVSVDTHWCWSNAETAPYDLMRWNNPQNTTEPWAGARDSGAQPGAHDVKIYASVQDGIDATVYTLLNEPYYGAIVANLRAGVPCSQWGATSTAGSELHAWGTGTAWLTASPYFGPAPTDIGDNVDQATFDGLVNANPSLGALGYAARLIYAFGVTYHAGQPNLETSARVTDILNAIKAIPAATGGTEPAEPDLTQLKQDVADTKAAVARIELALKGA